MFPVVQFIVAVFLIAGLLVLTFFVSYLWFFATAYIVNRKPTQTDKKQPQNRFVFVVPAHNEENDISNTVINLLSVEYPKEMFNVMVIADNCSDATAKKAIKAGADCLERDNQEQRGKWYALRYAFTRLKLQQYEAFVVIDADSIVSANFLLQLDSRLQRGEKVVQAYDGMENPDASVLTYLFQVGNLIENRLFWAAKQIFGLPIMLRGNGMCFSREVIDQYPWDAFSIVEDTEYGLKLVDKDVRIHFAEEIGVFAHQPETLEQAFAQRVRWASGNAGLTRSRAVKMVLQGVFSKNFNLADLGLSLIVGSKPLILMLNVLLIALGWSFGLHSLLSWAMLLLTMLLLYIGLGVFINGFSAQKTYFLVLSPFYLIWLCGVALLGMVGFRKNQWVRTSRQE